MTGQGGETRPTIGNVDPNTILASGTTISGTLGGTVAFTSVNIITGLTVSGGANFQNVTGFFWRAGTTSGKAGFTSGVNSNGHMPISMSGQTVFIPFWISA